MEGQKALLPGWEKLRGGQTGALLPLMPSGVLLTHSILRGHRAGTGHPRLWSKDWEVMQETGQAHNCFWCPRNWRKNPGTCCRNVAPCCSLVASRFMPNSRGHVSAIGSGMKQCSNLSIRNSAKAGSYFSNSLSRDKGFHSHLYKWHNCIPFNGLVRFRCIYVLHLYAFICQ